MPTRTHYDVLGVVSSASPTAVKDAYRRLAREYHPDRVSPSAAGGDKMPAINEAYRVLSDPARRAIYDASLRGGSSVSARGTTPTAPGPMVTRRDEPGDEAMREWRYQHPEGPARVPWRTLLVATIVAVVGIVVLAQFSKPTGPPTPDGILRNGDCVEVMANGDAREVSCTDVDDLVVRQFIAFDRDCSNGWERHRDRQGMGVACIERISG